VRGGEGALGLELHGAVVVSAPMGEPHLREPLGLQGRDRWPSEQERGREHDQEREGHEQAREPGRDTAAADADERRVGERAEEQAVARGEPSEPVQRRRQRGVGVSGSVSGAVDDEHPHGPAVRDAVQQLGAGAERGDCGHGGEEPACGEGALAGDAEREEQGAVREPAAVAAGGGRVQDAGDDEAAVVRQGGARARGRDATRGRPRGEPALLRAAGQARAQGRGRSAEERGAARSASIQGHVRIGRCGSELEFSGLGFDALGKSILVSLV
jgi:hypothetical protein